MRDSPSTEEDTDVDDDEETVWSRSSSFTLINESLDPFDCKIPEYAFPTQYPPILDYDPFPCRNGRMVFSKTIWDRRPSHNIPEAQRVSTPDVDSLIVSLAKLRISSTRDEGEEDIIKFPSRNRPPCRSAACMVTPTLSAPLPSFIRQAFPSESPHNVTSSTPIRGHLRGFAVSKLNLAKLDSTEVPRDSAGVRRKTAPFPMRRPTTRWHAPPSISPTSKARRPSRTQQREMSWAAQHIPPLSHSPSSSDDSQPPSPIFHSPPLPFMSPGSKGNIFAFTSDCP